MLSIIIPTYNEGENLQKILEKIQQVDLPVQKEIIVVDDGSTDNTRHILKNCDQKISGFTIMLTIGGRDGPYELGLDMPLVISS